MVPPSHLKHGTLIKFEVRSPITQLQLKAYAEASGDPNPIHLDEGVAKSVGLPGVIAHGMLLAAFIAERGEIYIRDELKISAWKLVRLQTRFKSMTFIGDEIAIGGIVKEVSESDIVLDLQAKNQNGEIVTVGSLRYGLR
ncbi:MAG: MaoC/PaaZ C-terminal domain-containing protein [Bdellovibrionota bacterium]